MERLKLNLVPGGVLTVCHASQYDNGRTVRLDLYDGDSKVTLAGTETITATLRKPSGAEVTLNVTNTSSDYVDVVTDSDTCDEAGVYLGELTVVNGSVIIGSANFVLLAEVDPYGQAQLVARSASGSIVNFNTSVVENLIECIADFSATQASGTPTPSAPIPIVGVDKVNVVLSGKNLISHTSFGTFADWKGDLVPFGDIPTSNSNRGFALPTKAGQTYTISFGISNESFPIYLYLCKSNRVDTSSRVAYITTNTKVMNRTYTFTADGDLYYLRMNTYDEPTFNTQVSKCSYEQLEFGNQATDYEAFQGTTALINLGGTYYGGSVDAVTGKITKNYAKIVFDGSQSNSDFAFYTQNDKNRIAWNPFQTLGKTGSQAFKSDKLATSNAYVGMPDEWTVANSGASVSSCFIGVPSTITSVADWQAYVTSNPITLVYELATPIVVYASNTAEIPTINGDNQVFADTGDVAVKYYAKSTD